MRAIGRGPGIGYALMGITPVLALGFGWEAFITVALVSSVGALLCFMQTLATQIVIDQIKAELPCNHQRRAETTAHPRRINVVLKHAALAAGSAVLLFTLLGSPRNPLSPRWNDFVLMADSRGVPHFWGVSLANAQLRAVVFRLVALMGAEVEYIPPAGWNRSQTIKGTVFNVADDISRFGISHRDREYRRWLSQRQ